MMLFVKEKMEQYRIPLWIVVMLDGEIRIALMTKLLEFDVVNLVCHSLHFVFVMPKAIAVLMAFLH